MGTGNESNEKMGENCKEGQPQSRCWADLEYIRRVAGLRTVPVELGDHYMADGWGQTLMTLDKFILQHVYRLEADSDSGKKGGTSARATGYLAQHQLFEQVPELRRDIAVPDYCTLVDRNRRRERRKQRQRQEGEGGGGGCVDYSAADDDEADDDDDDDDEDDDVVTNAWFGPAGTLTPAHTDPYHNLLCQVVGSKYIRLYAPSEKGRMYCHEGMMANTSQVDIEHPDLTQHPNFAHAHYTECTLQRGEALFIPQGHFHFLRSLEVSFSVSFWW
jgi:lysine-specific demethylase 8